MSDSRSTDAPSVVENTGGGSTPTTVPGTDAPAAEGNKGPDTQGTEENAAGSSTTGGTTMTGGATTTGGAATTGDASTADDALSPSDSGSEGSTSDDTLTPTEQEGTSGEEQIQIAVNKVQFVSGASAQSDGKLVWTPSESVQDQHLSMKADYTISGSGTLVPGTVRITLPLHILKDREGNWADSFECPYPAASEVTEGDTPEFTYVTDEEANTATLTNYKEVTAVMASC